MNSDLNMFPKGPCTHRNGNDVTVMNNDNGSVVCTTCGETFKLIDFENETVVTETVDSMKNLLNTIKLCYENIGSKKLAIIEEIFVLMSPLPIWYQQAKDAFDEAEKQSTIVLQRNSPFGMGNGDIPTMNPYNNPQPSVWQHPFICSNALDGSNVMPAGTYPSEYRSAPTIFQPKPNFNEIALQKNIVELKPKCNDINKKFALLEKNLNQARLMNKSLAEDNNALTLRCKDLETKNTRLLSDLNKQLASSNKNNKRSNTIATDPAIKAEPPEK